MNPWALIGLAATCKFELGLLQREEAIWPDCKDIKLQIIKKMGEYEAYRDVYATLLLAEIEQDYLLFGEGLAAA